MRIAPGRRLVPGLVVSRRVRRAAAWGRSSQRWARAAAAVARYRLARHWGVYLAAGADIGDVWFPHPTAIVIGAGVVIEDGAYVYQGVTLGASDVGAEEYPAIRSGACLFAGVTVIGGVEVGEGAVVGAGSLVLRDVPPFSVVAGSPARVVGEATGRVVRPASRR